MAMRAVPIKSALPTAAPPSMTDMGPPKAVAAREVAATCDPGVVPIQSGSQCLDRAETQETDSAQADNSKKRKADGEARQSPQVATAVAGSTGKRRASPEAEVIAKAVAVLPCNEPAVYILNACKDIQKVVCKAQQTSRLVAAYCSTVFCTLANVEI